MRELDFVGKSVLVVGGSSGIGNAIAQSFRSRGASVYVWGTARSAEDYHDVVGSNLAGLAFSSVDVSNRDAITGYNAAFDRLDVLVLSQGIVVYKRGEFERDGWDKVMSVNLDSVMACAVKFKSMLSCSGGSLIIVSSTSGLQAAKGNPAYAASKAGAISLTRTLGEAWASEGIRVNGVAPGYVNTKLTRVTMENEARRTAALSAIPAGRFGSGEEIAGVALFLASPLASYIYGQTIVVDGGLLLS